jgi:hypothetical protein
MVSYAGEAFSALGVEPDLWVAVVAQSRNRLTHHDKRRVIKFEPGDAYFLAESVFVLVMLCLLRECEVDAKTLANVRENPNMQFLCGQASGNHPSLARTVEDQVRQTPQATGPMESSFGI